MYYNGCQNFKETARLFSKTVKITKLCQIRLWSKHVSCLKSNLDKNPSAYTGQHGNPKSKFKTWKAISGGLLSQGQAEVAVYKTSIISKALSIDTTFKEKEDCRQLYYVFAFLKKSELYCRTATRTGQKQWTPIESLSRVRQRFNRYFYSYWRVWRGHSGYVCGHESSCLIIRSKF